MTTDRKEYFRNYYLMNKLKLNKAMKKVYDKDRELQRARCQDYKIRNKQVVTKYFEEYRNKNRELVRYRSRQSTKGVEYKIAKRLKRKYGFSIPVSLIREIREAR